MLVSLSSLFVFSLVKVLLLANRVTINHSVVFHQSLYRYSDLFCLFSPLPPPWCIVTIESNQRGGHSKYILKEANKPLMAPTLRSFCHFNVPRVPVEMRCHVICSSSLYLTPCHGSFQLSRRPGGATYKKPVGHEQWGTSCLQQLAVRLWYLVTFLLSAPCFP